VVFTAEIKVESRTVIVRELTVAEVRAWVKSIEEGTRQIDPAGDALFDDITLGDIALMSDAPADWLAGFGPSVLDPLAALCKKVNPHFFRVRAVVQAALIAHTRALIAGQPVQQSSAPPPP